MMMMLLLIGLIAIPGLLAYLLTHPPRFASKRITVGDPIVYRKQKASTQPGPRAYEIHASEQGEFYTYVVDKYWKVADILNDGSIVAVTRTNKENHLPPNDPNLRKAKLTERVRLRSRFPQLTEA